MGWEGLSHWPGLGVAGRPVAQLVHTLDPVRFRLGGFAPASVAEAGLVCVYRQARERFVACLVEQASNLRMAIALWALDTPVSALSRLTVGCGPGPRLQLLNRLCAALPPSAVGQLVVSDDDVEFARGNLGELLGLADACGFGLAQPAHAPRSFANHWITKARPLTLARVTTFVEVGPMIVISPHWRTSVVPFPEEFGMGWGLDLLWPELQERGCRLGIVDGVSLRHLSRAGGQYGSTAEGQRVRSILRERGADTIASHQRTLAAWRLWQGTPPWLGPAL